MTKARDPIVLWQHIEGFAHFLPGDGPWYMSDDSQGIRETLQLVGRAVMTTLTVPESHGLLKPECPIRDISLVLGRLIEIVMDWSGSSEQEEFSWVEEMIA